MNTDPLAQLKDIHLPEPVSWWPPAPLWWLLAAIILGLCIWLFIRRRRQQRQQAYRQDALQLWRQLPADSGREQCQAINILLKRTALHAYGPECATLHGELWLEFLDASLPGSDSAFSTGPGHILANGPYQPQPEYDSEALLALTRRWLKEHSPHAGERPDA